MRYSDVLRWVSRILWFLRFIIMYKTWQPAHTVDPKFYTSCSPKGVQNTGFHELHIIINNLWKPIKESLKHTFISWHLTWNPAETFIYIVFHIFWVNVNFCHWYFFMKPNQRKPETHLHKLKYHMTPSRNIHLHYIPHVLGLFLQMKPIFCTPPAAESGL